jgi:uncharacterized protein (TIGR03067 family)
MPLLLVVATLAAGFAPAPSPRSARVTGDLKEMQGAWVLVTITGEGGQTIEKAGALRLVIEGDRAKNYRGELSSEYALTLDASKSPKRYVFKPAGKATTEPVSRGIYSLGGGTLKFCTDGPGEAPPQAFDGPRAGTFLYVYKRLD